MQQELYGSIEAGGTKFVCAVGTGPDNIIEQTQIPTTLPAATLEEVVGFFRDQPALEAMGIASFGPLDLNEQSPTYGYLTTTPKEGWGQTDLRGSITRAFDIPVALDTDVNGAALAEHYYGAGQGLKSIAYQTVGTGIGIGCVIEGKVLSGGLAHTEMGHMQIPYSPEDSNPVSACPYHSNCLEGLASGTALELRTGVPAEQIEDPAYWDLEAYYLAAGIVNVIATIMPARIVIGGGVMDHEGLLDKVRVRVPRLLNGYVQVPEIMERIEDYIVAPKLGSMSGIIGALTLGIMAHNRTSG